MDRWQTIFYRYCKELAKVSEICFFRFVIEMTESPYARKLRELQALNRDKIIDPLTSHIPIHSLLDEEFCTGVSNLLAGCQSKWQTLRVTDETGGLLPDASGLYMFFWEPKLRFEMEMETRGLRWCLYVGKAEETTLKSRFEGEYKKLVLGDPQRLYNDSGKTGRKEILSKYLCLHPLKIWYLQVNDKSLISDIEKKLIDLLNPPLNTQRSIIA